LVFLPVSLFYLRNHSAFMTTDSILRQIIEEGEERYLPLVEYMLRRAYPDVEMTVIEQDKIRKTRQLIFARNAFLQSELKVVLKALYSSNISVILLKGVINEHLYPSGLRPYSDIDLLVSRDALHQAENVMNSIGYSPNSLRWQPFSEKFEGENSYIKAGMVDTITEIHWTLGPPFPYAEKIDLKGLRERAVPVNSNGVEALALSPEDSLLHSCLHLFDHRHSNWIPSACDITQIISYFKNKLDWKVFITRVSEYGIVLPVRFSLKMAMVFKPDIPSGIMEELESLKTGTVEKIRFAVLNSKRGINIRGSKTLLRLIAVPGIRLKLALIRNALFPGKDFMVWRYNIQNTNLMPLYYIIRLKDALAMAFQTASHTDRK